MKNVSFAAVFTVVIFQFCSFSLAEDIHLPPNPIISKPTQSALSEADSVVNSPQRDEDIDFSRHLIDGNFRGAASIQALDMDDDGDIDVVGGSNRSGVAWWENDGEQSFEYHNIADVEGVRSVAVADFGNDGDFDIVIPSYYDNNISLLINDGDFGFQRIVILAEYDSAEAVDAVDIDDDVAGGQATSFGETCGGDGGEGEGFEEDPSGDLHMLSPWLLRALLVRVTGLWRVLNGE